MQDSIVMRERAVLAAVDTGEYDVEASLSELGELTDTAEIDAVAFAVQKRPDFDRATCIGSGKLEEIRVLLDSFEAELVIFDHELTATQLRNIEEATGVAVLDRTMLILEIFAQRAQSHEGRLQVELAQHRYLLPRLSGMGKSLSRLGGGGGAGAGARRGAGETKLELDRRHIRRRIQSLERRLREMEGRRQLLRERRKKDGATCIAIMGYTNVGKSTLLGALTQAEVLVEDKLFATLDPTARALSLPDGRSVVMIDTVGLIRRLPHHLVEAFHSTLEEAVYADLILNVCDASSPEMHDQIKVAENLIAELGAGETPVLTVLNKCDRLETPIAPEKSDSVCISAKTGAGLPEMLAKIARMLSPRQRRLRLLIPYAQSGLTAEIRKEGKVFSEEFAEEGILLDALVDNRVLHRVWDLRVQE